MKNCVDAPIFQLTSVLRYKRYLSQPLTLKYRFMKKIYEEDEYSVL